METLNIDGWKVTDVIALLIKLGEPQPVPAAAPEPPTEEREEEPEHYFGFCDVCEHMHAFCQCEDG